jgi:[acyl-carrier-protein] S-malonyltransferase
MGGKSGWVFPGQGSQEPGMGKDLYEASAVARDLYDRADRVLGRAISTLCFEGPAAELSKTTNAQPAIFITSIACLEVARANGVLVSDPAFVAGHSLGEYSALAAAGAIDFDAGLKIVQERGRLTQLAADATPGSMAAIMGLDEPTAAAVCADAGAELCNLNSPGQIVIGGTPAAIERACALALDRGAKRAIPLDVGGAFHTSLMRPAADAMAAVLATVDVRTPRVPIIANDSASPMTEPQAIRDELVFQLTHPVRWVQCVEYMAANGVDEFVEVGAGRVLSGLIKRIASGATTRNINGAASASQ